MKISPEYVHELQALLGSRGEPTVTEVEKGAVRRFARAIGETNPLYFDEHYAGGTRFGGMIAPPTFVAALVTPPLMTLPDPPFEFRGQLHTDDVIAYSRPIQVGDVITATAEFTDVFVKNGRIGELLFKVFTIYLTDSDCDDVATLAVTEVAYL